MPAVTIALGATRFEAAAGLTTDMARSAPRSTDLLTEWNHWWPYEDAEISEDVFLANAEVAAGLGFEVALLDAGWFGPAGDTDWVKVRGDWHVVNTQRFPHGLAWLADQTRERGIEFGIWIEAEALGVDARVQQDLPEIVARDAAGESLGYVCLGSQAGRDRVREQVRALVATTGARWIKWDFNLDPGLGCQRSDHGHSSSNGLKSHYDALYALFDELRSDFGQTVWEACSSGGLRIDAGLAEHVDGFFLSDPDWTEHHLKVLWGASQMLPARQILHWVQSEWRGEHRFQKVDYSGSLLTVRAFDAKVRAAMLHRFGVSVRLTQMRPELLARLGEHLMVWKDVVRPLLRDGVLVPLAGQPEINDRGHRQPSFQLSEGQRHVLAAFRLPPKWEWDPVVPTGLDPEATYRVIRLVPGPDEDPTSVEATGRELMASGMANPSSTVESALWLLEWVA